MISAVIPPIMAAIRADAEFIALWAGVKPHQGETAPYMFLGEASEDWPKPYVVYDVYDDESNKFGPSEWPMKNVYLEFIVYDYANSAARCIHLAERIGNLLGFRGYATDPNKAVGVRTFENEGPVMVNTGSKRDVAYRVTFPLRGMDAGALRAKTVGPR